MLTRHRVSPELYKRMSGYAVLTLPEIIETGRKESPRALRPALPPRHRRRLPDPGG